MFHYPRTLTHHLSLTFIISLITINIKQIISETIYCYNAFQCVGQSLNADQLYSYGYKSSFGPSTNITVDTLVLCAGAFSCDSVSSLLSYTGINCYGSRSCSNIKHIYVGGYAHCSSASSCELSQFTKAERVYCSGMKSCANSLFNGVSRIYGYGAFSLYNATIYSTKHLSVNLYGEQSGFSAKLLCQSDHFCNINCAGNACQMMYIECNGNCIINKETEDSIAPITDINLFNISTVNMFNDSSFMNTANMNDNLCSTESIYTFDNFLSDGKDIVMHNDSAICCRGSNSCFAINKIQSSNNSNNLIICSGSHSCSNIGEIINNGNIVCSGLYSCSSSSNIITANNVYCQGFYSCQGNYISAKNIYCSGWRSCKASVISSNGNINIYFSGYESALQSEIYCNAGDLCRLFCIHSASCSSIQYHRIPISPYSQSQKEIFFIVAIIIISIVIIYISIVIIYIIVYWLRIYRKNMMNKLFYKPSLNILLFCIITDTILFIVMFWWGIKMSILNSTFSTYCKDKYYDDQIYCNSEKECFYKLYNDDRCKLPISQIVMIAYWTIWCIVFCVDVCIFRISYIYGRNRTSSWSIWDFMHFIEYKQLKNKENNAELIDTYFYERLFWIGKLKCGTRGCDFFIYSQLIHYIIFIVLTGFVNYYYHIYDYIYWFEYWISIFLLFFKIILQIYYRISPKYKVNKEIQNILEKKFGANITTIIKLYLPLYHNENMLSSKVKQNDSDEYIELL